jgi:hypothetical protein
MRTGFTISILLAVTAWGQTGNGTLRGTVKDPIGAPFATAPIVAVNADTKAQFKAASAKNGSYTLKDLPAGKYVISVNLPGLKAFEKEGLTVAAGKTETFDIHLEDNTQLGTLGEDVLGLSYIATKHNPPSGPAPRMANGKPDLSGTWWSPRTVDPGKPEFLPAAQAVAKARAENNRLESPQARCLPSPAVRIGPIYSIVESPTLMAIISDDDSPGFHQIYLDGRKLPADATPEWYGHNYGHWEGGALIVDRFGFNEQSWLDQESHPHSDKLHVIERYTRPDLGHLETEVTVEDPGVLAKPYTMKRVSDLAPNEEMYEFICPENNRDVEHMIGK